MKLLQAFEILECLGVFMPQVVDLPAPEERVVRVGVALVGAVEGVQLLKRLVELPVANESKAATIALHADLDGSGGRYLCRGGLGGLGGRRGLLESR